MTTRTGRRPGDQRVRVTLTKPSEYETPPSKRVRRPPPPPALVLIIGFLVLIAVGSVLLALPIASASGAWTAPMVAFFTATSAVCVTGLIVVDTGTYWSPFGQAVILGLIQVGGFGFMTGSTLILFLLLGRRTRLRDRVLVQAATGDPLGSVTALIRRVAAFTVIAEVCGAIALTAVFLASGDEPSRAATNGVFHSISAFNNAGFDIRGDYRSLAEFIENPLVLGVIGALIVVGGLGFAIIGDSVGKHGWQRLALETKVVLLTTAALLVGGTIMIGALEWSNPATLGSLDPVHRVTNAAFTSITARTAGFNSIATASLAETTLIIVIVLMFIGGASGSTAGGIKVNTFGLLLIAIISTARGDPSAMAFGRRIPHLVVYRALAVALLSIAVAVIVGLGLELSAEGRLIDRAFETVSALGTVGMTTGITPGLSDPARLLVAAAMFAGRLGPLTLVLALTARSRPVAYRPAVESMRIG